MYEMISVASLPYGMMYALRLSGSMPIEEQSMQHLRMLAGVQSFNFGVLPMVVSTIRVNRSGVRWRGSALANSA